MQHSSMDVLLPTENEGQSFSREHLWPTLYLLHGLSDDHTVWQRWSSIERYLWAYPLAVVMPTTLRGFYTDMAHGPKYFTFLSDELPTLCEKLFRLSPVREDRFTAGLSMGGYGAFKLALRHPDRFSAAASLSGALDAAGRTDTDMNYADILPDAQLIFGDSAVGGQDDLFALARGLTGLQTPLPKLYQCCGTEDTLLRENRRFAREFGDAFPIEYHEAPGVHDWAFWDEHIQNVLAWLPLRERSFPKGE